MALPAIPILSGLISLATNWLNNKQELKKLDHAREVAAATARIERAKSGDEHSAELDMISLRSRGWKDEYLLFLATAPVIMTFMGGAAGAQAAAGFEALGTLPEWYMWILLGIYIDTFGFRRMLRVAMEKWVAKKFGG